MAKLERGGCAPIVVASHPRSGTHLCIDTLRLNFPQCASSKRLFESADHLYLTLEGRCAAAARCRPGLVGEILGRVPRPVVKTHALPDLLGLDVWGPSLRAEPALAEWLRERATFVYAHRDGRDVLVSLHRYMQSFVPEARVPLSEFLRQRVAGVSRVRIWADHVQAWRAEMSAHFLAMEDLLHRGAAVMPGLADHLSLAWGGGEVLLPPKTGAAIGPRLVRRVVRRPASTSIEASRRLARLGWCEAFGEADREFFAGEAGGTLIELGYEANDGWVTRAADERAGATSRKRRAAATTTVAAAMSPAATRPTVAAVTGSGGTAVGAGLGPLVCALACALAIFIADVHIKSSLSILYGIPVLIAAPALSRRGTWALTGALALLTLCGLPLKLHHGTVRVDEWLDFRLVNRCFVIGALAGLTWLLRNFEGEDPAKWLAAGRDGAGAAGPPRRRPPTPHPHLPTLPEALAAVGVLLLAALDLSTPGQLNAAILYGTPLELLALSSRRVFLAAAAGVAALVCLGYYFPRPPSAHVSEWLLNRLFDLIVVAAICARHFAVVRRHPVAAGTGTGTTAAAGPGGHA